MIDKHTLPMRKPRGGKAHFMVPVEWTRWLVFACDHYVIECEAWAPTSYEREMEMNGGKDICKRCLRRIEVEKA